MSELTDAKILETEILEAIRKFESKTGIAVTDVHRRIVWNLDRVAGVQRPSAISFEIEYVTRLG